MLKTRGSCYPREVIVQAVFLKLRFSLTYRDIEGILKDRGIGVDHATSQRWVVKYTPELEKSFHRKKRNIGKYKGSELHQKFLRNHSLRPT
jgi:putative transposase